MSKEEFAARLTPEQIANYPKANKIFVTATVIVGILLLAGFAAMVFTNSLEFALDQSKTIISIGVMLLVYIVAELIIFAIIKAKYPYYKDSVYRYLKKTGRL